MHIGNYIELLHKSEEDLAKAYHMVGKEHGDEPDVYEQCELQASWSEEVVDALTPFIARYSEKKDNEPDRLMSSLFDKPRMGSLGLLRDLHDLWLMANETQLCCVVLRQAADGLRDKELKELCTGTEKIAQRQLSWLMTRMKSAAPQTLIVG